MIYFFNLLVITWSFAYNCFCFSLPKAKMGGKEMPCVSQDAHKPPAQTLPNSSCRIWSLENVCEQ